MTATVDPEVLAARDAAARRRREERADRVRAGLLELDLWLTDQLRGGLAGFDRLPAAHLERMAARLVDAQAPGVAGLVRGLRAEPGGADWPDRLLDRFAALHLLSRAHRRLDELPAGLAATVRSRIGYPVRRADVAAGPGHTDGWLALGVVDDVSDDGLALRQVWLWGLRRGEWAMTLDFAGPGTELPETVPFGELRVAAAHRYPGSGQFRVVLGEPLDEPEGPASMPSAGTVADALDAYGLLLALDPWAPRMPVVIRGVPRPPMTPGTDRIGAGSHWQLVDALGHGCPLLPQHSDRTNAWWELLAISRGRPLPVFGLWSPAGLTPLAVLPAEHGCGLVSLSGSVVRAAAGATR